MPSSQTRLPAPAYLDHLRRESARFRDVLAGCDPAVRVPACPEWDAADLLWHLTEVQWHWATVIATRPAGPPDDHPDRPATYDALLAAFDEHSAALVDALAQADPSETAWSWFDADQTVGFTVRRQAHEALVHRLDAEQTVGEVTPLDPALAADGVAELVDVMYGGEPPAWGGFEPGAGIVRIDLEDAGAALWARPGLFSGTDPDSGKNYDGPHVLLVDDPGHEPDAILAGRAADVDTWLWKRGGDERVRRSGDDAVLAAFDAAVSPPLT